MPIVGAGKTRALIPSIQSRIHEQLVQENDARNHPQENAMSNATSPAPALKRTPLYDLHLEAGGRMVEFGGWEMPVQYRSIIEEHQAVRTRAGLFDVSHMGEFKVEGGEALAFLQYLVPYDV